MKNKIKNLENKTIIGYFEGAMKGRLYAVDSSGDGRWVDFVTGKSKNPEEDDVVYFLILDVILPSSCLEGVNKIIKEIAEENYPGKKIKLIEEGSSLEDFIKNDKS